MRTLLAPILIGTLVLAGALPAAAQPKPASDKGTVGMAPSHDPAAERKSYTQQAQGAMRLWEQRLHDFNAKLESNTTQSKATTSKDLDSAWNDTKTAWNQLETAGVDDWNSARATFQGASHKLGVAWQRVSPKDK